MLGILGNSVSIIVFVHGLTDSVRVREAQGVHVIMTGVIRRIAGSLAGEARDSDDLIGRVLCVLQGTLKGSEGQIVTERGCMGPTCVDWVSFVSSAHEHLGRGWGYDADEFVA